MYTSPWSLNEEVKFMRQKPTGSSGPAPAGSEVGGGLHGTVQYCTVDPVNSGKPGPCIALQLRHHFLCSGIQLSIQATLASQNPSSNNFSKKRHIVAYPILYLTAAPGTVCHFMGGERPTGEAFLQYTGQVQEDFARKTGSLYARPRTRCYGYKLSQTTTYK